MGSWASSVLHCSILTCLLSSIRLFRCASLILPALIASRLRLISLFLRLNRKNTTRFRIVRIKSPNITNTYKWIWCIMYAVSFWAPSVTHFFLSTFAVEMYMIEVIAAKIQKKTIKLVLKFRVCSFRPVEDKFLVTSQARATRLRIRTLPGISKRNVYILHKTSP